MAQENNLVCEETSESWIISDDDEEEEENNEISRKDINFDSIPMMGFDDSISREMIEKEKDFKLGNDYLKRLLSKDSEFLLRNEAINWIWKACAHHNFGPLCLYLSINYLDRFLTSSELPKDKDWAVQLLAVSCLSLAAKMEETFVPQSVDLQVEEPKFVFEAKTIKRMELLVLNTLNWRMQVVTPFSFIDYFAGKIIKDHHRLSENCIYKLILNTTKEVEFLEFKASEIAAAAAIAVSFSGETDEKALSSLVHVKQERVERCLKMMRDMSDKIGRGGATMRVPESPNGVLEAMCLSYKSDGSCTNSTHNSPNNHSNKRRKQQ